MNGRFMAYDHMDLFDGFQQSHSNTSKGDQQQRNGGYNTNNSLNNGGGGPCAEDYDPTGLLDPLGNGSAYNSTATAALNNAGAQLAAATMRQTPLQYGLFRPSAPCPNPTLIQNNIPLHQQVAQFQQQQQQRQQQQRQQQQRQQQQQQQRQPMGGDRASLITNDYEPVPLPPRRLSQHQHQHQPYNYHQQQQQQNHDRLPSSDSIIMPLSAVPSGNFFSNDFEVSGVSSCSTEGSPNAGGSEWLENFKIEIAGLSLELMTGQEVIERLRERTNDVVKRFLPCVDFLVACQQDLRKGLMVATQKRLIRKAYRDTLTPKQFFHKFIEPLPQRFLLNNRHIMQQNFLRDAYDEVVKLAAQARVVEHQGCEAMKNTFLGGMKDGESWGLRKWLSKHGGALSICTDLELILSACQKLDKELDSTKNLAAMMRSPAKKALDMLRNDVPKSYQEVSTAHPYLPFFHRLEAALRSVSNFDPEDDDVICLDDSDDEVETAKPKAKSKTPPSPPATGGQKRPAPDVNSSEKAAKQSRPDFMKKMEPVARYEGTNDDSDDDSEIEIIGIKPAAGAKTEENEDWTCTGCSTNNGANDSVCNGCKMSRDFLSELMQFPAFEDVMNVKTGLSDSEEETYGFGFGDSKKSGTNNGDDSSLIMAARLLDSNSTSPFSRKGTNSRADPRKLAQDIDALADVFDIGQQSNIRPRNAPVQSGAFWDGERYASALRLFAKILRMPEAEEFVEPVDDRDLYPPYHTVIKNPLCFQDIVSALIPKNFSNLDFNTGKPGRLPPEGLKFWNMWLGQDLLQAVDLVLLNALAYGKIADEGRSTQRSDTNRLRKVLWNGIQDILVRYVGDNKELHKQHQPTRRGETSGFVILKDRSRIDR